jgi:hypothetical protein
LKGNPLLLVLVGFNVSRVPWILKLQQLISAVLKKFPVLLQATIEKHWYLIQEIYILDETALFWK